ncbi:MAG: DUF4139 domain-containing protein [Paracoccus sp. (in: a-proteobacteria)]
MYLRPAFPAFLFGLVAAPALADRVDANLVADHVTVYPSGAEIDWRVEVPAMTGQHQIVIPGLPAGMADSLRIRSEAASIGNISAQADDPAAPEAVEAPAITTARERLDGERNALRDLEAQVEAKRAEAASWQERIQMVRDMMRGDSRVAAGDLAAGADTAGGMIATYLQNEAQANAEAAQMANRLERLQRNVQLAEADLGRILDQNAALETLTVTVNMSGQPAVLDITGFTGAAGWRPVYDLTLTRATGQIHMDRAVMVSQSSGVDWGDVNLTLSTAQPNGQTAASEVSSWFPYLDDPSAKTTMRSQSAVPEMAYEERGIAPVMDVEPVVVAEAASLGITVVYNYPARVTVANNQGVLRLALDQKTIDTNVFAEAAPRYDDKAYVMAEGLNTLDEPILPGQATVRLDGALIGSTDLPLIAAGDDVRVGFGPILGMTAELRVPEETEGERGFISRSNQQTRTYQLIINNLTDEEWPLRIVDRVPVSRQEDLEIGYDAEPEPTTTDPDGRRGVLYWEAPLPAGESREIAVSTDLRWPEGKYLNDADYR